MHPVLKEALFDNWDTIVSNLNFELIIQKFMWAFSPDEYESVILESGETARCEQLLLVLSQKGDALFYELIKLLKVNAVEFKASPKVHSEVFHKIIKHIKNAYGIQSIKNSKCYGLSEPDVFFVNRFASRSEEIVFPFSLLLEAKEDIIFDKRAQICDSFCWSLMRENKDVRCVVFHKLISGKLNAPNRVNSLFFDLFFWITNKPGTLLGLGELEECFSVSQMSLINWLRRLASKLKVVLVMGFLDYQEGDVQVLDALTHAGISTLVYFDHAASEKIVGDVSKFGVVVQPITVPEMIESDNPELTRIQVRESPSITASMSQLLAPMNNCEAVFKELPHNIQTLVNHCAILEDRVLSMKTLKHLWRYLCRDQTADHMEVHTVLDVLINKRIVTHFLDSYFLAPSMKQYLRSQIGQMAWKLLHQNFLQAYLEKFKNWLNVPESDSYFHRYLIHHLIEAGGKSEIVNLLSNLEWLLHRCRCDLLKQLPFDVQLLLTVKDEDKDSLNSFLKIFDILIQLNPGTNYKMFLTYTIASLCNKIGASSIFTKLFTSLSKVVTRGFWFLPLHDSIIPKLTSKIRQVRCVANDVKVIFSDSKVILLASQTELILLNRTDLTFTRSIKFSTEFRIVLVTLIKEAEVNFVTENSDLWVCDFSTGTVQLVTNLYPSCRVIKAYSVVENSMAVTVHNNGVLKIWCSVSFELSAAISLANNGVNFSTPDAVTVSCASSEEEIVRVAVVCTGKESNSCYVLDYDCETMDLTKVATIAMSSDIENGYISKSGEIIVSTATDASIEIYSIETETFIRTPGVSSSLQAKTRSGLYVFLDDSGLLDLCTLEGETQVTPVFSQKLDMGSISQCYIADDVDDLIVVSTVSNSEQGQRTLSILALQSLLYSSLTNSRIAVKAKETENGPNQVLLNGDGSLIYSILANRIICEATDTLNPVQVYSLPANVTSFCYTEAVFGGLVCLFFDTNAFILLKCPSFDRLFDSTDTKTYTSAPFFCFFSEHLLYFVFESFIEIWDCQLLKNLIINIPVEMPISDAAISGHCLQLLHRNGMVRSINLQDMTWDVTGFNSSPLDSFWMRPFFLYVPVLKDWLVGYVSMNFIYFTGTVNLKGSLKFDLGVSSSDYNPLSVQVAGSNKLCVILEDSTKQQIILKVYDFKDRADNQSYTLLYEDSTYAQYCRTNPSSICIAPDISKMLWVEEKTAYVALVSPDEYKVVKLNVSENITKSIFVSEDIVFICCDDFTFHLCALDMSEDLQKVTDANSCHEASINKVDYHFEKQCSWIVSCDAKGSVCFWVIRPDRCKLKLVHSQELSSPVKTSCSSFFDTTCSDSKLIYASVSEDENLNIWIIDTKVVEIESFIQREAPSFACCLLISSETVQYLSNDYAISTYDYVTSTFVSQPQIPENLRQFRTMHRFLGTSGLIASSCPTSSEVLIWDSVSQGFCASLSSQLVAGIYSANNGSGEMLNGAFGDKIMDIKVIPEFCLILVGFQKYLDVWLYNEEALLLHNEEVSFSHSRDISSSSTLDSNDTVTSSTNTSKKVARLDLMVTLKSIIVSDYHSLIAVIDSTGKYHLMELYSRKLFNRSGNARISHYEKFIN